MDVVPVLTALTGWEARLGAELQAGVPGLVVVQRCPDLEGLLVAAATGVAEAVLVSAALPALDQDALVRLRAFGVAVVGVAASGDEAAERRLRQLGLGHVLAADVQPSIVAATVREAWQERAAHPAGPGFAHAQELQRSVAVDPDPEPAGGGRVVAVWGPTGAPGRTTVALGLAAEVALLGWPTLLVDADPYGGTAAERVGLRDEPSGLAAACRAANLGALDTPALSALCRVLRPSLSLLSGLDRADRWPELRPAAIEAVLALARALAAVTVVDCGFCLEQDEELSYDTLAPRRNGATLAVLEQADLVVVVGTADPVGLGRLTRGLGELRELRPDARTLVVANRLRASAFRGAAEAEVRSALQRDAGVERLVVVPAVASGHDAAAAAGRLLHEVAPDAPARLALQRLALSLVPAR